MRRFFYAAEYQVSAPIGFSGDGVTAPAFHPVRFPIIMGAMPECVFFTRQHIPPDAGHGYSKGSALWPRLST